MVGVQMTKYCEKIEKICEVKEETRRREENEWDWTQGGK